MVLRTRWYKVISDLWRHRTRTLIVALAVAVGIYAVGTVLATQALLLREYRADREQAQPASAVLAVYPPFDDELVDRIAAIPGVAAAEGRQTLRGRVLIGADVGRELQISTVSDFATMAVDRFLPVAGVWPQQKDEIMLEWMGVDFLDSAIGETLIVELSDGTRKELTVTGSAHNPQIPSPGVTGFTSAVVLPETMTYLGRSPLFSTLHLRTARSDPGRPPDDEAVRAMIDAVKKQIERSGREVVQTTIIGQSIIESIVNTTVLILTLFGWIILLLSAFLVVNSISALLAQQINQIGIMKLVGASRGQVATLYLVNVLFYGIIALALSVPLAILSARLLMSNLVEGLVNIRTDSYAIPLWIYLLMIAIGLLIPTAASLLPVWRAARSTTYAMLNALGIEANAAGHSRVDRLLGQLPQRYLGRPFLLALRNTLRHKGRLLRTMIVLVLGTALFVGVVSVRYSVDTTQADFLRYHGYDVAVHFEEPHRIDRIEAAAAALPGVTHVESWGTAAATRQRSDGSESNRFLVYGLPESTQMVDPVLQEGRWLEPGDWHAVVINATLADEEPDIDVGETILLDLAGHERPWMVVGVVGTDAQGAKVYMNRSVFARETRTVGHANALQVRGRQHDAASQAELEAALRSEFERSGFEVQSTKSTQTLNAENELMFDVIVSFLVLNAVLLGAVGSLGLSTTMGINMMERIREIGVLRAIGASNAAIRRIVLLEGFVITSLSWGIGFLLSYPTASWMSRAIGLALLDMPLSFTYSVAAGVAWYFVLLGLGMLASLGPARGAVNLTIREVLAYE